MKIKSAILSLILMLPMTSWAGKTVTITVTNDENEQRQELVEIDLKTIVDKLALGEDDAFVVRNAFGQQVDYQVTYDGKLLIDVSVRPCGKAQFTVSKGVPEPMKTWVKGKMYPTRKDDIAWENDRGAYRVYGPALQRTGEKSFGTDVWTKNTPEIVVEDRYTADYDGNILKNIYHKKGQGDKWRDEDLHTSFHLDHGNGLDCYSVGSTLGCGTPALMDGNTLIYPYCYKEYEILEPYKDKNGQICYKRVAKATAGTPWDNYTVRFDQYFDTAAKGTMFTPGHSSVDLHNPGLQLREM